MRLQYQIILATFLPIIVFGLLSGGVGGYALQRIPQDLILERQTALAQVAAAGVAGNLRGHVRLLETTAGELADQAENPIAQQRILRNRARVLATFTGGVWLLDVDGDVMAGTVAVLLGRNFADREFFREVRVTQSTVFSTALRDELGGHAVVFVAVPVQRDGAFLGVLLGSFELDRPDWARELNLLKTPQGGRAYLIDGASTIIYHPDAGMIGQSIQSDPDLWRLVIAGQPQSMLHVPRGADEPVVVAFAPVPGVAWGLVMEEPWEAILAASIPYQWIVSALMAVGMVLALVALVLSVNRVIRPLNALVAEGQRVARGQPLSSLAIEAPPDLRTLIQVINEMVTSLARQQNAVRQYAMQVLRSQEEERLRISRELHDETVQDLVALTQRLELSDDVLESDVATARDRLREVRQLAHKTLVEVRRISSNLRPLMLEDLGLAAALRALTVDLERQLPDAQVRYEVVGEETRLPPELELTAFRIVQEALSNVRRHAAATLVHLALFFEDWGIMILVEDDGVGFDVDSRDVFVRSGHLGLVGMIERAELFGGELRIVSNPGEGTTVRLRLPRRVEDSPDS